MPGVENKYLYFFGLPASQVDKVLIRFEQGLSSTEISNETGLSIDLIEKNQHFS